MLHLIDAALEAFLRATVPLSAQDVDVSFEAPDREWSAKLDPADRQRVPVGHPPQQRP